MRETKEQGSTLSSCDGDGVSSSIGSAILGAWVLTTVRGGKQRGEEGSWEMGLQGRRGDTDRLGSVVCKGDGFVPRGRWLAGL